jgi:NADPH-dependent F420 reductase
MTRVTIIGAGNMGRGIGTRLVSGGHDVQILAPTPEHASALAQELGEKNGASAQAGALEDKIEGEVVILATPFPAAMEFAQSRGSELAGRVLVDITNPVNMQTFDSLVTPPDSSAAQEIAKHLPPGVPLVKAFNTTFAGPLAAGSVANHDLDVLVAGDDEDAKTVVATLVESSGMKPIDAGPLRRAQQLEHLGFLHMALQNNLGTGFGSAVKFVSP